MVKITAAEVNKLRQATGAGMMDCKNALVEAEGDFDKAIEVLRKKGQKVAAKRADRENTEGVGGFLIGRHCSTSLGSSQVGAGGMLGSLKQFSANILKTVS